jgi:hypothetical protein
MPRALRFEGFEGVDLAVGIDVQLRGTALAYT